MIREWLQSVLTKSDPRYRQMGYVYASVALEARYNRCQKAWSGHIQKCREIIADTIPENCGNVLVIGSGPLLEFPAQDVLEGCKKLFLLDVVHPRKVQSWAKRRRNVHLLTLDATGFADTQGDEKAKRELRFEPPQLQLPPLDYIISANVISQFSLEPFQGLKKKYRWADDDYFVRLSRKMGDDHIQWLKSLNARRTLLIGDVERIYFDRDHQEVDRAPSAYQVEQGHCVKQWDWLIAPLGEVSRHFGYRMHMKAQLL